MGDDVVPEQWEAAWAPGQRAHVMPLNDWVPHTAALNCWCRPRCEDDTWVHNSMDRREDYETGRLRFN